MFAKPLRKLFVLIFLFAVLEKTGCDLLYFLKWHPGIENLAELVETESSSKESENTKEKSLKEFWICNIFQNSSNYHLTAVLGERMSEKTELLLSFYPSVPTPPPNFLALYLPV